MLTNFSPAKSGPCQHCKHSVPLLPGNSRAAKWARETGRLLACRSTPSRVHFGTDDEERKLGRVPLNLLYERSNTFCKTVPEAMYTGVCMEAQPAQYQGKGIPLGGKIMNFLLLISHHHTCRCFLVLSKRAL